MSNVFVCTGTVGKDAEVRYLPSGQAVLNVSVANNIGFGDKQKTIWLRVVLWGKRAEGTLKDYLLKGQQVFVSGELTTSEYTKNDGTKGFQLELNADIIDLIGKKNSADAPPQAQNQSYEQYGAPKQPPQASPHEQHRRDVATHNARQEQPPYDAPYDDDIPF
jgi:single-strand DNA-binding protein